MDSYSMYFVGVGHIHMEYDQGNKKIDISQSKLGKKRILSINLVHVGMLKASIVILFLSFLIISFVNIDYNLNLFAPIDFSGNKELSDNATSVWCQTDDTGNMLCTFRNLCFSPRLKQFIFVFTPHSILHGVNNNNILKHLELSSVQNHNNLSLKLMIFHGNDSALNYSTKRLRSVLLLHRFKWDNIMHVIHDDLMPLFFTYMLICAGNIEKCVSTYNLAYTDEGENGPFQNLYSLFSHTKPVHLHKEEKNTLICFDECRTGIVRDSVWYQYGFGKPQGPVSNTKLTGEMVRKFSVFIKKKLLDNAVRTTMYKSVLVSRKINRKILNEHFVIESVKNAVRSNFPEMSDKKFYSVDLTVNRTGDIVSLLAESKLLVGMHGSAMILSMFMEPGSVVIEMFPYAINASHVSAVRSLCNLKSLGLVYRSWTNMEESNSVPHPESPPLLGGIVHLSPDEQQHVRSVYPVPAVYCCHDPAYLYRMFQDTIVGDGFVEVLGSAFQELKNLSERRSSVEFEKRWRKWYFPAEVTGIGCDIGADKRTVRFTWMPPVNVGAWDVVTYKLAVVGAGMALLTLVSSQPWLSVNLPPDVAGDIHLNIWVKSEVNSSESADVHSLCHVRV